MKISEQFICGVERVGGSLAIDVRSRSILLSNCVKINTIRSNFSKILENQNL